MARCEVHSQSYEVAKGEWCALCGDPNLYMHPTKHVCQMLGISDKTVRKWFEHEEGVIKITTGYNRKKINNVTLRIPMYAIRRVQRQLGNKPVRRIS